MIKAVVFDFDGLIIDTETVWFQAYEEVFQNYNVEFPIEVFTKCIGTDNGVLNQYIDEKLGESSRENIRKLAKESHKSKMKSVKIRDGVEQYLSTAKQLGLKIGLASSSSREWVEDYLIKLQIYDYFQVIKTGDQVDKVKPDPALYLQAIEALNVNAYEAVAFEDSANGAAAAIAAGLKCVIVPNEVTQSIKFGKYDLRINSMSEMNLEQVIKHLEQNS